ncbi:MAG: carbohydrate ABC transporter permease, partial [Actinomycetota bacterium]
MAATSTTPSATSRRREPAFERRGRLARQLVAVPVAALFLVPLWLMVVASLRPLGDAPPQTVQWFPTSPAWANYAEVFEVVPFARYTANSLLVAVVAVPLSVVVASWAGFAIARLPRRS